MITRPGNLFDLTSPWFGRSQLLERRLVTLYRGMTFGDVERRPRHPQLVVTATDMTLGTGFDFTADTFRLICSDLHSVPLSFAVTASSAVPLLLSPMTLRNYGGDCPAGVANPGSTTAARNAPLENDYRSRLFQAQSRSYSTPRRGPTSTSSTAAWPITSVCAACSTWRSPAAAWTRHSARSRSRLAACTSWCSWSSTPSATPSATSMRATPCPAPLLFGAGNRATVETQEFLADIGRRFREDLKGGNRFASFAPDAELFLVLVNLRDAQGEVRRQLLQVPTAFTIGNDEVTSLVAAGRSVLRASKEFQALRRSLGLPAAP